MAKHNSHSFALSSVTLPTKLDRAHKRAIDRRCKYAHGTTTSVGSARLKPVQPKRGVVPTADGLVLYLGERHEIKPKRNSGQEAWQATQETRDGNHVDYLDFSRETLSDNSEDGFIYSFDHPRGPSNGEEVLGAAVDAAVEKFEEKVTERMVRDEYSVVDEDDGNEEFELV